jgi:hypothetical protein
MGSAQSTDEQGCVAGSLLDGSHFYLKTKQNSARICYIA